MDDEAYHQYEAESADWLKSGRRRLLSEMLRSSVSGRRDLQILELGAGVGQNIETLREFGTVDASEINPIGLGRLRETPGIRHIYDQPIPFELDQTYDVIVAADVIEHIEDDSAAVAWIAAHLKPGGIFVSTVPAYQFLFSEHDVALHHFRRYTASNYTALVQPHLSIERRGYFNSALFPAVAAVRLIGRLKPKRQNTGPARKQSAAVPGPVDALFRGILKAEVDMIRMRTGLPFGLSVYCVARRAA